MISYEISKINKIIQNKIADNRYPINDLLRERWSPRAFDTDRTVSRQKLRSLFEAVRWAPSSYNEQPWRFIVASKDEKHYQKLFDCLKDGNKEWAGNAPVLGVSVVKLYFDKNEKPNRHAFHDVGMAMSSLIVQATTMDLYVHQMAGFYPEKIRESFNLPEGYEAVAMFVIGYLGDPDKLSEKRKNSEMKKRSRNEIDTFVFGDEWGSQSDLIEEE